MKAHKLYEIEGDKIKRKRKFCPKCEGSFLAEHKDRFSCGNCGYTEFKDDKK
ncbi:MAG: 30S ribosomal protein S27ae [Thermoplasmatota archaeon]